MISQDWNKVEFFNTVTEVWSYTEKNEFPHTIVGSIYLRERVNCFHFYAHPLFVEVYFTCTLNYPGAF